MIHCLLRITTISISFFLSFIVLATEIHVLNEFGKSLVPDKVYINGTEIENPDSIFYSDNGAIILSKGYLPFVVKKTQHKTLKAYLKKRKHKPISVNTTQPVFIIIQNIHFMEYFESYLFYSDILLPEFSEQERVYIYSRGYFPELTSNYQTIQNSFELIPSVKWFRMNMNNKAEISPITLFENDITPDGYITAKEKDVIIFNSLASVDISKINSGDTVQIEKAFRISFAPFDSHYQFRILKNNTPLNPALYKISDFSITGLSKGDYTIQVKYKDRICRVFSPVILNTRDIFLGPLNCSLTSVTLRVLNSDSIPVMGALIITQGDRQTYKTDKKGQCVLSLLSNIKVTLTISKKEYSSQKIQVKPSSQDSIFELILYKGAQIIVSLPEPDISITAKGICIETREPVNFVKKENYLKATHINPGHYQLNFMDVNSGMSRTYELKLYDEETREISLDDIYSSLSGTISPVPPASLNTVLAIQVSGENGQSRSDIHEDGSFSLSGVSPGTYALSVKTKTLKTLYFNPEYIIKSQDETLNINMEGSFWEGEILLPDNITTCRVIFKNTQKKAIMSFMYELEENLLFIPKACDSVEFVLSNNRKIYSSDELRSIDSLFLW